jgi:hypothetical protein
MSSPPPLRKRLHWQGCRHGPASAYHSFPAQPGPKRVAGRSRAQLTTAPSESRSSTDSPLRWLCTCPPSWSIANVRPRRAAARSRSVIRHRGRRVRARCGIKRTPGGWTLGEHPAWRVFTCILRIYTLTPVRGVWGPPAVRQRRPPFPPPYGPHAINCPVLPYPNPAHLS